MSECRCQIWHAITAGQRQRARQALGAARAAGDGDRHHARGRPSARRDGKNAMANFILHVSAFCSAGKMTRFCHSQKRMHIGANYSWIPGC
jgi:hypothetical protein